MQKLAISVMKKCMEKHVTSSELDVLLYISRFQNDCGVAEGVYYKDVCEHTELSYQGFYDVLHSLRDKDIISYEKNSYYDYDVTILDNDFSTKEAFGRGYVHTGHFIFTQKTFRNIPAGAKLMAMHLLNVNMAGGVTYKIGKDKLFKNYMEMLGVSKRIIQKYLKWLRLFFYIGIKDGKYFITIRNEMKKTTKDTDSSLLQENYLKVAARRNRIKETNAKERKDTKKLFDQYANHIGVAIRAGAFNFSFIVQRTLAIINEHEENKYKWQRRFKASLIHKIMREELGLA